MIEVLIKLGKSQLKWDYWGGRAPHAYQLNYTSKVCDVKHVDDGTMQSAL